MLRGMSLPARLSSRPCTVTAAIPASSMPLGRWIEATRWLIMNTALHSTAQASAISSTISNAGMRCLRRLAKMGRISMVASGRLELGSRRQHAGAPGGQQAGQQAGDQGHHEGEREHRQVEMRQLRVLRRLMADAEQAQLGEREAKHAAGEADDRRLHHELHEDLAPGRTERPSNADLL